MYSYTSVTFRDVLKTIVRRNIRLGTHRRWKQKRRTLSRVSVKLGKLASMSFMSSKLDALSLPPRVSTHPLRELFHTHLFLNPACSLVNRLKSTINLSIASFMCMCRISVHIGSSSFNSASFCSIAPRAVFTL